MLRPLLNCLGIAGAGALGALARYGVVQLISNAWFPWATLTINLTGAFALGFIYKAFEGSAGHLNSLRLIVGVGFLGAFTTFSSMMWESDSHLRDGSTGRAAAYLAASLILGLVAVRLGFLLGQQFSGGAPQ